MKPRSNLIDHLCKRSLSCDNLSNEVLPYTSNILTYMISYMRARLKGGEDLTYADYVFVNMSRSLTVGLTGWLGGVVANKIGLRPALAIGMILYRLKISTFTVDIGYCDYHPVTNSRCCESSGSLDLISQ